LSLLVTPRMVIWVVVPVLKMLMFGTTLARACTSPMPCCCNALPCTAVRAIGVLEASDSVRVAVTMISSPSGATASAVCASAGVASAALSASSDAAIARE
jgi:hypothetical protein